MSIKRTGVIVAKAPVSDYFDQAPFHPSQRYPEYNYSIVSSEFNGVYESVRNCFILADLDSDNFDTAAWNPLGDLISPGETVVLKPNFVKESHPRDPDGWQYILTHGSVIRAVADYVWKALDGTGKVVVADAPQADSSFDEIVKVLDLEAVRQFYLAKGLDFELVDLRPEELVSRNSVIVNRRRLDGDPNGYIAFDLGQRSEFIGHEGVGRYYGADYDDGEVNDHHSEGRHEYLIAGTTIKADVVFSLPKLKTHKKAGITVSLKNLVGINGNKNWLPHHTEGSPLSGGDEHPHPNSKHRFERKAVPYFRRLSQQIPGIGTWIHRMARRLGGKIFGDTEEVIRSGNWWGNDTTWRMCLDLNKILLYGNPDGTLRPDLSEHQKRHYVLVDGIIAGEGRGPMNPDPVPAGVLIFGLHPVSVDAACACLMGFDPDKIPVVRHAFHCRHYSLAAWDWRDVQIVSNRPEWNGVLPDISERSTFHFEPHFGWKGHIERM